ncbi:CocE/NonD family hydrolase [Streptomyces niveus]
MVVLVGTRPAGVAFLHGHTYCSFVGGIGWGLYPGRQRGGGCRCQRTASLHPPSGSSPPSRPDPVGGVAGPRAGPVSPLPRSVPARFTGTSCISPAGHLKHGCPNCSCSAAPSPGLPVILVLTPYGADRYHQDGRYFSSRGYHFVSIDSRGRGDSGGRFVPFENDGADGHDAIAWLAEQTWSTGGILTYGASYSGYVQWAIAATQPPALRALAPVASVFPGVDFPAVGGIPTAYAVQWLTFVRGRRLNTGPLTDDAYWREIHRDLGDRPFRDLDVASAGERLPAFQEWLNHPTYDAYWARLLPPAPVDVPVLAITGQYDDDQLGTLTYNARHPATHLVVGPWDHAGTRTAARSAGWSSPQTA